MKSNVKSDFSGRQSARDESPGLTLRTQNRLRAKTIDKMSDTVLEKNEIVVTVFGGSYAHKRVH